MNTPKQTIEITHEEYVNLGQWMMQILQTMLEQDTQINKLKKELAEQKAVSKALRGLLVIEKKCSCHGSTKEL